MSSPTPIQALVPVAYSLLDVLDASIDRMTGHGKVRKSRSKGSNKVQPYVPPPISRSSSAPPPATQVPPPILPNPAILTVINIDPALLASAQLKAEQKHPSQAWKQLVEVKWSILSEYTRWLVILRSSPCLDEKAQQELHKQLVIEPQDHPAVAWLNRFKTMRCEDDQDEEVECMTWCKGPGVEQNGCETFFRPSASEDDEDKCNVCQMKDCAHYLRSGWCRDCHVTYATRDYGNDHIEAVLRSSLQVCTKCKCRYLRAHGGCAEWYNCDE
jgi:hypothetical protein